MNIKLFDSELKIMENLWQEGDLTAGQLVKLLAEQVAWNKNTTYTVIKKCIGKGAIERTEPGFLCHPLITREQTQAQETDELIGRIFEGSEDLLFASLLNRKKLPPHVIEKLKGMIEEHRDKSDF